MMVVNTQYLIRLMGESPRVIRQFSIEPVGPAQRHSWAVVPKRLRFARVQHYPNHSFADAMRLQMRNLLIGASIRGVYPFEAKCESGPLGISPEVAVKGAGYMLSLQSWGSLGLGSSPLT